MTTSQTIHNQSTSLATPRRFDLDWIRIVALALLVLYHVGMYYVSWDWHVKSPTIYKSVEPFMFLTSPWRLSLLFAVSGAAVHFMLQRRTSQRFALDRCARLLPPLIFAMLVVVPPQSYYEVLQKTGQSLDYLDFWGRYLIADGSFCKDGSCLKIPTWNHMWFVAYLWIYAMCLAGFIAFFPPIAAKLPALATRAFSGWRLLAIPIAFLAIARIALVARFPSTHDPFNDWYNHAVYLPTFLFGVFALNVESIRADVKRMRWFALGAAFATYIFLATYFTVHAVSAPPEWLRYLQRVLFATNQWCAIVAVFGFAQTLLNRDSALRRYLSSAIFPIYLFHQTVIIVVAAWLVPFRMNTWIEAAVLVSSAVLLSVILYECGRRVPILRVLIGASGDSRTSHDAVRKYDS